MTNDKERKRNQIELCATISAMPVLLAALQSPTFNRRFSEVTRNKQNNFKIIIVVGSKFKKIQNDPPMRIKVTPVKIKKSGVQRHLHIEM